MTGTSLPAARQNHTSSATPKLSRQYHVREQTELPFYCRPVALFLAVWVMMLLSLEIRISYATYPNPSLGWVLFACSAAAYFIGFFTVRAAYRATGFIPVGPADYVINLSRLRRLQLISVTVIVAIGFLNVRLYGLPPIFGFFGADVPNYGEYGSLKQILFPAIFFLFLSAPLDKSWIRRWFAYLFAPFCLLVYSSRGYLLIMLFQGLAVFSLRTSLSKKKIYLVALLTLATAVTATTLIGDNRESIGVQSLIGYLHIRDTYKDLPSAFLWFAAYISTPISNMCWIIHSYPFNHPSLSFIYSALPGSLSTAGLETKDLGSDNILDGVHTYMAKYYLDLWFFGIFAINYFWGFISARMSAGNRLTRNYLSSAALLGCIAFLFFADFLTIFNILVELSILGVAQRYCRIELPKRLA